VTAVESSTRLCWAAPVEDRKNRLSDRTAGGSSRSSSYSFSPSSSSIRRGPLSRTVTTLSVPTWVATSSAVLFALHRRSLRARSEGGVHLNWFRLSPALLILIFPLGFRFTCYYYRRSYYRAFWWSPPACA